MVAEPASEVAGGAAVATHLGRSRASFRAGELGLGGGWAIPEYSCGPHSCLVTHTAEWKENWNGSLLGSGSTASERLKCFFPAMFVLPFLTSTGHLGCSGKYKSPLACRLMTG